MLKCVRSWANQGEALKLLEHEFKSLESKIFQYSYFFYPTTMVETFLDSWVEILENREFRDRDTIENFRSETSRFREFLAQETRISRLEMQHYLA